MNLRASRRMCVVTLLSCVIPFGAFADSSGSENAALRKRVEQLENEIAEIRKALGAKPAATPAELTAQDVAKLKEMTSGKKKPVTSGLELTLYGYVKLDAAYDDSRVSVGNYGRWVESEATRGNDNQFSMTANQTRLGLNIAGPTLNSLKTSGKVEIDFYGAGVAENKPEPLLRHAYLNAEWLDSHFSVLAGQTSDIISPLFMPTVNYTVGWWQGNIGYRRPQIRLTQEVPLADSWSAKVEAGASRTITDRRFGSTDPYSGDDSGWPTLQGRVSFAFPVGGQRQGTIGLSGHYGEEEQHTAPTGVDQRWHTWSANVDLRVPVTKWLTLQAEAFIGCDLDPFLGGVGQGFNTNTVDCIEARGGWVAVTLDPHPKWQFNLGAGLDDPNDGDLPTKGRTYNYVLFGNGSYAFTANFSMGLEISHLRTGYKDQAAGEAWREQLSLIYKF